MELQTTFSLPLGAHPIDYGSKIILLGSCFAEHIGEKLQYFQFRNCRNPLGIFFHPKAIEAFIKRIAEHRAFAADDVFEYQELWHSFEAHSRVSQDSREKLVDEMNKQLDLTRDFLGAATHVFLTLGTAWGYRLKATGQWVANCHKVTQDQFSKELLGVSETEVCLNRIVELIHESNPKARVVFSVSPVRHLKDGFIENQRSKAHLITAVHKVVQAGLAAYFPAYELMMDELRDYRFYAKDMVHPNPLAVEYIWEKFTQAWIAQSAASTMREVEQIRKGIEHRPFNLQSTAYRAFASDLQQKVNRLKRHYPFMEFNFTTPDTPK